MRRICYVTGTRADFGLMERTLRLANTDPRLDVSVCVTGMHLLPQYGYTVKEIEAAEIRILARIPVMLDGSTGGVMARAIGHELVGMVEAFDRTSPNLVLVLGDRGEMLAGALAAIHLNIPVAHVHGGERSGTVDEPVRHAISKLAHYHFVTTKSARERLIRMGERPEHIFVTGAPGLDSLTGAARYSRHELCSKYGFDPNRPLVIMVFHPVLQEWQSAGTQASEIMQAIITERCQALCLMPNSDAGGQLIRDVLRQHAGHPDIRLDEHLTRDDYLSWLSAADALVGNSSSGIIEAATFGLPVINVGSRQDGRERSGNVIDAEPQAAAIALALRTALKTGHGSWENIYGDGRAGERIVELLATVPLSRGLLLKTNAY